MHHRDAASPSVSDGLAVVVVAAGSGTRLGYGMPKALVPVDERPVLGLALETVRSALPGAAVVVTVPPGDTALTEAARAVGAHAVTGGATRAQSVARALAALPPGARHVLVHDAARCLAPPAVFERVVGALESGSRAVVPVTEVPDTVRGVDEQGRSTGTVDRSGLRAVQTPQGFDLQLLERVNERAGLLPEGGAQDPEGITDDASLVERFAPGVPVELVPGDERSFKITRPLDLVLARAVLAGQESAEGPSGS